MGLNVVKVSFQMLQIKFLQDIKDWQRRPLDEVYPTIY